jgi:riboflavin kinase/FMN adenylyltransferase
VRVFEALTDVPEDFGPSAVTIGKFDGVHAGHRAVISELRSVAAERELTSVVVTFDRHPLSLLNPEKCPDSLVSNAQKLEKLDGTGIDAMLMLTFDRRLSEEPAEEFVLNVLVGALRVRVLLVGADFRFGARGAGDVSLLRSMGAQHGFEVRLIEEVRPNGGRKASSTWIRELLGEGRVAEAAELLGALPSVRSTVVHGKKRGRELGYPTANLSPDLEGFIPADGVYATWATIEGTRYGAAVSIGNNPTFEGIPDKQVEAHLFDQELDLYGKTIVIEFVDYIRGMNQFANADALVRQMEDDEFRIRAILGVPARR